jgi:hypothetical protein
VLLLLVSKNPKTDGEKYNKEKRTCTTRDPVPFHFENCHSNPEEPRKKIESPIHLMNGTIIKKSIRL